MSERKSPTVAPVRSVGVTIPSKCPYSSSPTPSVHLRHARLPASQARQQYQAPPAQCVSGHGCRRRERAVRIRIAWIASSPAAASIQSTSPHGVMTPRTARSPNRRTPATIRCSAVSIVSCRSASATKDRRSSSVTFYSSSAPRPSKLKIRLLDMLRSHTTGAADRLVAQSRRTIATLHCVWLVSLGVLSLHRQKVAWQDTAKLSRFFGHAPVGSHNNRSCARRTNP